MAAINTTQASPGLNVPTPGQPMANIGIPPNMSVQAAMSAGLIPANAYITNEGVGANITIMTGTAQDGGSQAAPSLGVDVGAAPAGGSASGGGSAAGGMNMNSAIGVVGDVCLANRAPAANVTYQGGTSATQYAG